MRCPSCSHNGTRVLDSRPVDEGRSIRRRRECESCLSRFTTFERVEASPREEFNKEKILRGLIKACEKRPVSLRQLEEVTQSVERELRNLGISEVKSDMIGEIVMEELRDIDDVAYVRFASVYRQFKDLNVFIEELKDILQKERE